MPKKSERRYHRAAKARPAGGYAGPKFSKVKITDADGNVRYERALPPYKPGRRAWKPKPRKRRPA